MPEHFPIEEIAKRGELGGLHGLRFGKKPTDFVMPHEYGWEPTFKETSVYSTMDKDTRQTFQQENVERGRFLEEKHNLAGTKKVKEYEGIEQGLAFDPMGSIAFGGQASYDSGEKQGGTTGASGFLGGTTKTRDNSRGTDLVHQDPYAHKTSDKISIRTG